MCNTGFYYFQQTTVLYLPKIPNGLILALSMSSNFLSILLLLSICCQAQIKYPKLHKAELQEKIYHGFIDGKHSITMYIKFNDWSNYHLMMYSVKGWYYYDKIKTPIPLAGIYLYDQLILYNFEDTSQTNELLYFRKALESPWDEADYYKDIKGYKEKFILSSGDYSWTDGKKVLPVSLQNAKLDIQQTFYYLELDSNNSFDLSNIGEESWNYSIHSFNKNRIILEYEYPSNFNIMGRCGAAPERGFLVLEFDNEKSLMEFNQYTYESCMSDIVPEKITELPNNTIEYHYEDYTNSKKWKLVVDKNIVDVWKLE